MVRRGRSSLRSLTISLTLLGWCSHPFIYFPAFFAFKGLALGEADPISYAKTKYENEIVESVKALWMVWVPCQVRLPRHTRDLPPI